MPSLLATVIISCYILWLLVNYSKNEGRLSPGLWIPLIWIGINASRPVAFWFASGANAAAAVDLAEGNAIDRNIYILLILAGVLVLSTRRLSWERILRHSRILLLLYAYYLVSTLWSEYTYIALKRWVKDAGDIVMIFIILTDPNPERAFRGVLVRVIYVLVPLSVLFIKWYPVLGRYTHRWSYQTMYSGVTNNKNSLGLLAMIGGVIMASQLVDRRTPGTRIISRRVLLSDISIMIMCLWILSIADSATALACFMIGVAAFSISRLEWFKKNMAVVWSSILAAIFLLGMFTTSEGVRTAVTGILGRDSTLTERTVIWENSLDLGTNPIIGSGFSSTWMSRAAADFVDEFHLAHAHNGYLEVYLHTGLLGLILVACLLFRGARNAGEILDVRGGIGNLMFAIFMVGLFYNYTEVAFSRSNVLGLLISLLAALPIAHDAFRRNDRSLRGFKIRPGEH